MLLFVSLRSLTEVAGVLLVQETSSLFSGTGAFPVLRYIAKKLFTQKPCTSPYTSREFFEKLYLAAVTDGVADVSCSAVAFVMVASEAMMLHFDKESQGLVTFIQQPGVGTDLVLVVLLLVLLVRLATFAAVPKLICLFQSHTAAEVVPVIEEQELSVQPQAGPGPGLRKCSTVFPDDVSRRPSIEKTLRFCLSSGSKKSL